MTIKFLDYIGGINDYRVPGMITYPLEEILFATFIGLLCRAEDFDDIALLCVEELEWLRIYLPFRDGIPQPQTFRKVFALLDPQALEPVHDLLINKARKARATILRLELSLRSQFFQRRRHFSSQEKERSTTQRLGITSNV